jgi:hypothetical protein
MANKSKKATRERGKVRKAAENTRKQTIEIAKKIMRENRNKRNNKRKIG